MHIPANTHLIGVQGSLSVPLRLTALLSFTFSGCMNRPPTTSRLHPIQKPYKTPRKTYIYTHPVLYLSDYQNNHKSKINYIYIYTLYRSFYQGTTYSSILDRASATMFILPGIYEILNFNSCRVKL